MNRLLLTVVLCFLSANAQAASWCGPKETDLDQNWDCKTSADFWFRSQGSQLIPYKWFQSLEEANTSNPFVSDQNLVTRFGYIAVPAWAQASVGTGNPGNLPIGFASDTDAKTGIAYLGLTCAACHTGQIKLPGVTEPVIVNGGQGLGDLEKFLRELVEALEATAQDDAKFKTFAGKVGNWPGGLRNQLKIESARLRVRLNYNTPAVASGFGRVDAFGQIFNQVVAWTDGDHSPADAPVSYPALWLAPKLDHVQWNGVASNLGNGPMLRNLGEVMGVFARFNYTAVPLIPFRSSINKANLNALEAEIGTLWPPRWPGSIDPGQEDAGAQIYVDKCQTCHPLNARTDVDPSKKIKVKILEGETDPRMAQRFLDRSRALGKLRYWPDGSSQFKTAGLPSTGQIVLGLGLLRVWAGPGGPTLNADNLPADTMDVLSALVKNDLGYKAGPLNGIWATAPYLHNGSVPTLAELFSASRSPNGFCVGSRNLDQNDVGYKPDCINEESKINLSIDGNRNAGHIWGTELLGPQRLQLIEYLKSL